MIEAPFLWKLDPSGFKNLTGLVKKCTTANRSIILSPVLLPLWRLPVVQPCRHNIYGQCPTGKVPY